MKVVLTLDARRALASTVRYYDACGRGRDFLTEVVRVSDLIRRHPAIARPIDDTHRRMPLRGFPYGLIYRIDAGVVRIGAIAANRREPGYWRAISWRVEEAAPAYGEAA